MQVASPTASLSPVRVGLQVDTFGSVKLQMSPSTPSQRRLRRSLRLSGASLASPPQELNKENVRTISASQPSTSAKTLDVGASDSGKHGSTSPLDSSPLRSRSSPLRNRSPLRRALQPQSDDIASSSDDSDASTLVFFGKPSSAEKKKRIHYEQRVLEKRLKHKDSLDLARRRPISFNPDDTMLMDDQYANGWSWFKSAPTPSFSHNFVLSSPIEPPTQLTSPTKTRGNARSLSPVALSIPPKSEQLHQHAAPADSPSRPAPQNSINEAHQLSSAPESPHQAVQRSDSDRGLQGSLRQDTEDHKKQDANALAAAQSTSDKSPPAKASPIKRHMESPCRPESPIRSVETLIGATMAQNRDLHSPIRSPRRSPRLSLRAQQQSTSPTKIGFTGLFFGSSTPFKHASAPKQPTPYQHSTPFQQPPTAPPVPPSTGLSRFACLQDLSPINARLPETPANRALSIRRAHHMTLPSPFISDAALESPTTVLSLAPAQQSPARSSNKAMRASSPTKHALSPQKQAAEFTERRIEPHIGIDSVSPSKLVSTPATPSVRFAVAESIETPSKSIELGNAGSLAAHSPSPTYRHSPAYGPRTNDECQSLTSPVRQATTLPCTPPPTATDTKPETPGPVFRQTARRVPMHQHEAEFGVKVSPEKPSYSPHRAYSNSSARTNDFGVKQERIPARRVQPPQPAAARQISARLGDGTAPSVARAASVASKAARTVSNGPSRIGSQSTSLPAAALARAGSTVTASTSSTSAPGTASAPSTVRVVSSSQGSSVASKASHLQRPASAAFGVKPNSPSKQARTLSGLPRPRQAQPTNTMAPASGPGSRLPRPATMGPSANSSKRASRPVPMAIARLAPSQQGPQRSAAASATLRTQLVASSASSGSSSSSAEASPSSEASTLSQDDSLQAVVVIPESADLQMPTTDIKSLAPSRPTLVQSEKPTEAAASDLGPRRLASASSLRQVARDVEVKGQPAAETHPIKTARMVGATSDGAAVRSSSPAKSSASSRPPWSARSAPPVVLDPEQQRLRCLAMQQKARNRTPKASSGSSAPASSDMDEWPASDDGATKSSSLLGATEPAAVSAITPVSGGAPSAVEALAAKHAEAVDAALANVVQTNTTNAAAAAAGPTATSTGRPLRSTRTASRQLTPSATRVPPSRGRALSLNDIIAARKIDVPLSLTDQLKLADTVNKKHNEKTLARYKITKVQRPYERPPSPDRHDHEPDACTIIDDHGSHRQGKGDLTPYSTPIKSSASSVNASTDGRKSVRWYRPLFVGKGAQYGVRACESRPALKPIPYELDRMGNKMATGCSPKLSKGQSIVIYRNYFKGEPEPADD